jgi:hypothetical protein
VHFLGQAADVVMCLNRHRCASKANGLNHIRVERALNEPCNITDPFGLGLKNVNEFSTDRFPFFFRLIDSRKRTIKLIGRIDTVHVEVQIVLVNFERVLEFAISQQAIVDKDARLSGADRFMHQHGCDRRVHATR